MNADGSGQRNLTRSPATEDSGPAWSPDGRKILFGKGGAQTSRFGEIWVMNPDGSGQQRVTGGGGQAWSPDSRKIAFTRGGNRDIYVMNADGSGELQLTRAPTLEYSPIWSPDGQKIAFLSSPGGTGQPPDYSAEIYVMNADGSGQRKLVLVSISDTRSRGRRTDGRSPSSASATATTKSTS